MKTKQQICLIILDGWGYREEARDNAIAQANIPFFRKLWHDYPHCLLVASGEDVGVPEGQMGNSEVGHITIGAGKVVESDLLKISKAVRNHEFGRNPAFQELFAHVVKNNSVLHVHGLVSPGGIHSHQGHLFEFLRAAKEAGVKNIAVHVFTDGRDTPPQAAAEYVALLEEKINEIGVGRIASVSGRYYAMDRDHNIDRTMRAWDAMFEGKGSVVHGRKASEYIRELYAQNINDEFIEPVLFPDENGLAAKLHEHDGVFFFNFRADRARQLTKLIAEKTETLDLCFVTMTEYDKKILPAPHVAFAPDRVTTTLSTELSKAGLTQVHIAETEKYAHVTYFLNNGAEKEIAGEKFVLIPSRKDVATHDLAPEMKAKEIADSAIQYIEVGEDVIILNFANADMVGHSANVPAIITALEIIDVQLKRIFEALDLRGGVMFITADHGNAELNRDQETGEPHTAHTLDQVPAIITKPELPLHNGGLRDVAPTLLALLSLPVPATMTGRVLFESK